MARIAVIGGGFGGTAAAARLAKLGHDVTVLERSGRLGGALGTVEADGFTWDAGPTMTLLPAVIRDLFRKSGRPLEKELELVARDVIREHWFADGSVVTLRGGSRGVQYDAFEELGAGLGAQWCDHVASYADDWEVVRREYLERPWRPEIASKEVVARLQSRTMLAKRLKKDFRDERLRLVAGHPFFMDGHDLRNVPAWMGVNAYVEQNFGTWTTPGGMAALAEAMADRLRTRRVDVRLGTTVTDIVQREGRAVAVATDAGEVDADAVVCAIDPRLVPALAPYVVRTTPAIPAYAVHVGLDGEVPDLGPETVFHGDPTIVVRTGGTAPAGCHAWTLYGRGHLSEDMVLALSRMGANIRANVVTRVDRTPRDQVSALANSPLGVLWQGRDTLRHRLGPRTPIPGVYAAGASATPGSGLPFVGLSASLVAQEIGPA
ncbi:phytoene desaturase family protein [Nocardioides jiangxiensis]|uniref:NAD(P)/FAD-dependent oxidoreductase n=1 Tax=Nocardioides jiangxiensis TaxID=3064524 RepID=A0ABT9B851_9ACTN|nr:NAD(P)/FAD-dependent oxidoreductase [Nocardioides sp. WY-20]MDO7869328.1 NAD(P)/FAD-dependent oxidoreductase [Nocardioides sp. WY-20]